MEISKMNAGLQRVENGFTTISWAVCIFVTLQIVIDITLRFLLNRPLPASWEISEICMPFIVFFPFARATTINTHVRVTLVEELMGRKVRFGFNVVTDSISFVLCALLTYWSWLRFLESFAIREEILAAIKLPWWLGKLAMPLGLGLFTLRFLMRLLIRFSHKKDQ